MAEGCVSFRDNLAVADQLVVTMRGVVPPPSGFVFEGWLIADDGVTEISEATLPDGDQVETVDLSEVKVKGKTEAVRVFAVLDYHGIRV